MRILITNRSLAVRTGTEVAVRDLSLEMKKQGHDPEVYCPRLGPLAEEVVGNGIAVYDDLKKIDRVPEIIHGHHHPETLAALLRFPNTAAVFVCHDATAWYDEPLVFPRVLRHVAVDYRCKRRLDASPQILPERIRVIPNAVDLSRFLSRPPLPRQPMRAAIFSNYASERTHVPAIAEACSRLGISFNVIGKEFGTMSARPEDELPKYDLVFAKARCALEAMAVGCAVVLCDFRGLGPMVTANAFGELRKWNFGAGVLTHPLVSDLIIDEIQRYDSADAAAISKRVRKEAGLGSAVAEWIELYHEVCRDYHPSEDQHSLEMAALSDYLVNWGYDARVVWEKRQLQTYMQWPIVGPLLRRFVERKRLSLLRA